MDKAVLLLEDGAFFTGTAFGRTGTSAGEVVFNTAMTGYQETLTDPSYNGQIVAMTYPLIGNYGFNDDDVESSRPRVEASWSRSSATARETGGARYAPRTTSANTASWASAGSIRAR